jgi:4-alpha-glucanotransferase
MRGIELDNHLKERGMITISERLQGVPMDFFHTHAEVVDLHSLMQWATLQSREKMEQLARHDLGIYILGEDVYDFILGQQAQADSFRLNLKKVLNNMYGSTGVVHHE